MKTDWMKIKEAIENNWFETDPKVSDDELDSMAINVAGEVDKILLNQLKFRRDYYDFREKDAGVEWSYKFGKMKEGYDFVVKNIQNDLDKEIIRRINQKNKVHTLEEE